jgi:hypothetical protein
VGHLKLVFGGFGAGLLSVPIVGGFTHLHQDIPLPEIIAIILVNVIAYVGLAFSFFAHFINAPKTSLRMRFFRELQQSKNGLFLEQILVLYDHRRVVGLRIERLRNSKEVVKSKPKQEPSNFRRLGGFESLVNRLAFFRSLKARWPVLPRWLVSPAGRRGRSLGQAGGNRDGQPVRLTGAEAIARGDAKDSYQYNRLFRGDGVLGALIQRVVLWGVSFLGYLVYLRLRPSLGTARARTESEPAAAQSPSSRDLI